MVQYCNYDIIFLRLIMSRYIAITDIHGELDKLNKLLSKIETHSDDIFVFMGDYIDRGPDSKGVIETVIKQGLTHKCIYLIGSHEYALLHSKLLFQLFKAFSIMFPSTTVLFTAKLICT